MTNIGFVREINEGRANVRFIRESACGGNCSSCGGCKSKPLDIWVENTLELSVGDKVEIKSESSKVLLSAFILYILPLAVFLVSYFIASYFATEYLSVVISVVFFFLSFYVVRNYGKKLDINYQMVKKVN